MAVYTLFKSISGGVDWGDAAEPLYSVSPFLGACFCVYIAFAVLCVLNIVTGVFVENATQITLRDEENMLMEELTHQKKWMAEVRSLFNDVDDDQSGEVEFREFANHLHDNR